MLNERVLVNPVVGEAAVGDFLQRLHIPDESVLAQVLLGFEIDLVCMYHLPGEIRKREVGHIILVLDESRPDNASLTRSAAM